MINIGFLDSGVGGLAYLEAFRTCVTQQKEFSYKCIYLADSATFPYGEKSKQFLIEHLHSLAISFVETHALDIIVLACNTASLLIVDSLRKILKEKNVCVVGTVPAIKPAVKLKSARIYVMNTDTASHSDYIHSMTKDTKEKYGFESKVFLRACQELVFAIELMMKKKEDAYAAHTIALLNDIVEEIISLDCQAVVLGCTHFLHIKQQIIALLPKSVEVVDSLEGVCNRIFDITYKIHSKKITTTSEYNFYYTENLLHPSHTKKNEELKYLSQKYHLKFCGVFNSE